MPRYFILPCLAVLSGACAGPTTPFGALAYFYPTPTPQRPVPHHKPVEHKIQADIRAPEIRFQPNRQVLHTESRVKIVVDDPRGIPEHAVLSLLYNGIDASDSLLAHAEKRYLNNGTRLELTLNHMRLPPERANEVELFYSRRRGVLSAQANFEPPACDPLKITNVRSTGRFNPPASWMKMIYESSKRAGLNPSLMTGLIAQESSFNPRALSWAKAIGLTQVTPLADQEIEKYHADWPRYENIDNASVPRLKALILSGELGPRDDWRLDPELSVRGGLTYRAFLNKYWRQDQNYEHVAKTFELPEEAVPELVLASYNSGPARVSKALRELGPWYLSSDELQEAQKYVNRVSSFCYHFSDEAPPDENET